MTARGQRWLAIGAAVAGLALFLGANARLVAVAFRSQPACVAALPDRVPARHSC